MEDGKPQPVPVVLTETAWRRKRLVVCVLRGIAIKLTMAAAIVMTEARQEQDVQAPDGRSEKIRIIKTSNAHSLMYFTVANYLVCLYSIVGVGLSMPKTLLGSLNLDLPILFGDIVALVFLFSSSSAACGVRVDGLNIFFQYVGYRYANNPNWLSGHKFKSEVTASIILSMAATAPYLALTVMAILKLHSKSNK